MTKICNTCKTEKSLEIFSPSTKGLHSVRSSCKPCENIKAKKRRLDNPLAHKAALDKYRKSHPEVIARRDKRYYQKHKERLSEQNRQWKLNNPQRYAEMNRRKEHVRRVRLLGNGASFYTEAEMLELYGTACHLCGLQIDMTAQRRVGKPGWENGLHIDHLVPIAKGGTDSLDNVRPSHGLCNIKKGYST
jgi:5-methylcytosine-specific restriction endonuclease McrA